MSIELRLNNRKTKFSLDKLPDSLEHLMTSLVNLFDFPETVNENDISLYFLDEDMEKIALSSPHDFDALKEEHLKIILLEIDPDKLVQKDSNDPLFPLIFEESSCFSDLEPTVAKILYKRLREIMPLVAERIEALVLERISKRDRCDMGSQTEEFKFEVISEASQTLERKTQFAESQTTKTQTEAISAYSQTHKKHTKMAEIQTFLEQSEAEVQKSLEPHQDVEIQTGISGPNSGILFEERKLEPNEKQSLEEEKRKDIVSEPNEKSPKTSEQKPQKPETIKIEFLLVEFTQPKFTVQDKTINLHLLLQNTSNKMTQNGEFELKIAEKFCLGGETKVLKSLAPKELLEIDYKIKNPGAEGKYGGFLEVYSKEPRNVISSYEIVFDVSPILEKVMSGAMKKAEEFMEFMGSEDQHLRVKAVEFFEMNPKIDAIGGFDIYNEKGGRFN